VSENQTHTLPQRLRAALTDSEPKTLKELSAELSQSEKDLVPALEKLRRTLERSSGQRRPDPGKQREELGVEPARCIACGFEFEARERLGKPGRCPACRSERIDPPRFYLRGRG
jgi:predicted Zn-ribbon and HTH transcriptional regulator